jgi:hypothetical protein
MILNRQGAKVAKKIQFIQNLKLGVLGVLAVNFLPEIPMPEISPRWRP